jgi:multiple sugar transport system permease protein
VRKISKDEFKKTYFKSSEESAVFAKDLENSTDAPVIIEEEATTGKKEKKVVTARKDMTMAQWTIKEMKRNKVGYLMIAPFMLVFCLFTLFPVLLSLALSFTSFNMLEFKSDMFVGISNYTRLFFDDDIFLQACKNTLVFAMVTGPVSYILSFLVAWFINELAPKIRALVTLVFYAPSFSGNVYLVWQTLFHDDANGWVNGTLLDLGLINEPILWFHDENYAMTLCIVVALWMSLGTSFLNFIAGLQGIDRSLYEAGAVDGIRSRWQELWYITLPSMRPQLMFGAIMSITSSFGFGGVVTNLCGFPSVDYAAHTIMHHLDDYGGQRYEIGYSSAIAVVLFVIMIGSNALIKKLLSKVGQ